MAQPLPKHEGIAGLTGNVPVGAVLTIGTKGPTGAPTHNDRFYFKVPNRDQTGERPGHPQFSAWNSAPPAARTIVRGHLVHATAAECFESHLKAQVLPGRKAHPSMLPGCVGDGVRATRLFKIGENGEPDDFREIPCPNDLCEFRQGEKKACKPFARLYFMTRWNDDAPGGKLPSMIVKLTTGSWNTARNLIGFFEDLDRQRAALGLSEVSLYGLPLQLSLIRKTNPRAKTGFPVLTISPMADIVEFFSRQRAKLIEAGAIPRLIAAGPLTPEERDPVEVAADYNTINPGHVRVEKPSVVAVPDEVTEGEIIEPGLSKEQLERIQRAGRAKGMSYADIERAYGRDLLEATANDESAVLKVIEKMGAKR